MMLSISAQPPNRLEYIEGEWGNHTLFKVSYDVMVKRLTVLISPDLLTKYW